MRQSLRFATAGQGQGRVRAGSDCAIDAGATIHEHRRPEEEVYEILEGELEIAIDGVVHAARPGVVAIVPVNARHFVRALTASRVIVIDHPARPHIG